MAFHDILLIEGTKTMKNALISVSNKARLDELGARLSQLGFTIFSTGGTAEALRTGGIRVTEVADYTGFPEMMGGRLKTLHPMVFGGILADRSKEEHVAAMNSQGMAPFSLVIVNFYPFEEKVKERLSWEETIESIDIGGPSMVRAAAKNHEHVTVVVDPADYDEVLRELSENDTSLVTSSLRRWLAFKAFKHTSDYDAVIAGYLNDQLD